MTSSTRNKDELTLHAYCDGELDAATMAEFEGRRSADAGLRDSYNGVMALRRTLRTLPSEPIPPELEFSGEVGDRRTASRQSLVMASPGCLRADRCARGKRDDDGC